MIYIRTEFLIHQISPSSNLSEQTPKTHAEMILVRPDQSEVIIEACGRTVEDILISQDIDPLTVLITKEGEIIPEDTIPDEEDRIRIIQVSHGG